MMQVKSGAQGAQRECLGWAGLDRAGRRVLLGLLRPYRTTLAVTLGLMLAQSLMTLVNPWLAGRFAFAVLHDGDLLGLLLAWFAVIVVQGMLAYAVAVRTQATGAHLGMDVGTRLFEHLQALPLRWHQRRGRGDVLSLLLRDVDYLASFVTDTLTPLLPLLLTCAGALLMMARIEPWFAVAAAVLVPLVYLAMRYSGRRLRPLGRRASDAWVARSGVVEQSLALLPVVKAFTGEPLEARRYRARSTELRDLDVRMARNNALIGPAVRVASAAAILVLLWLASLEMAAGRLTTDGLVSLLLYGLLLTRPVASLAGVYGHAHSAHAVAKRLVDVFGAQPEPAGGSFVPNRVAGEIRFEQVDFAYPDGPAVLQGLDLHLRAGETVALTGANGAGKTTLMHLLLRFMDPDGGRIVLDGQDLRSFDLAALRGAVGLVPQQVLLFQGSVRDNIAYGRLDAADDAIEQAARLAQAHDFIMALAQGYDTPVGDDGARLSGGQRQRLALARALLKDPAVLVLDEATAMFDPAGEQALLADCAGVLAERSVLLITHRPASLALADRVLRLEDGRLAAVT